MELGEAARAARHDQVRAAQGDVVAILAAFAKQRERWGRVDEGTLARVEDLLEQVLADADDTRVCHHAREGEFDRAPRPLVLDVPRRIVACWEGCYWRRVSTAGAGGIVDPTCFDCGRPLAVAGHDLFIAYGPILVVAALCPECRRGPSPASGTRRRPDG